MNTTTPLPETMLAVRAHRAGDLRVDRQPVPAADDGDVLLRVLATGVCATDRKLAARGAPGGAVRTLGHEVVGEVVAGTPGFPPGTRVAVAPNIGEGSCRACLAGATNMCPDYRAIGIHLDGGMAEYLRVPRFAVGAGNLLRVPDDLADLDAVLLEPLACCLEGLQASGLEPGESVLVVAAGVMGRLHVAAARALGAGTVIVVDPSAERLEHARTLGADVTVETGREVAAAVADATAGAGVDVVAVTVGDAAAARTALTCLAPGGRANLFAGFPPDGTGLEVDANAIHYRGQRVLGTTGASKPTLARTLDLLHRGRVGLDGMVSATFGLAEAASAFEAAGALAHARVVLVPEARS